MRKVSGMRNARSSVHYVPAFIRIIPMVTITAAASRMGPKRSLSRRAPINAAMTTLVSRRAATMAMVLEFMT